MRAVLGERPWELDPILVSMPFNEDAYALKDLQLKKGSSEPAECYAAGKTQLCFAIEWDDGIVHPHPPITRALREIEELNTRGEVVGINSQIFSNSGGYMGVSFAIPIEVAMNAVRQIKETAACARMIRCENKMRRRTSCFV